MTAVTRAGGMSEGESYVPGYQYVPGIRHKQSQALNKAALCAATLFVAAFLAVPLLYYCCCCCCSCSSCNKCFVRCAVTAYHTRMMRPTETTKLKNYPTLFSSTLMTPNPPKTKPFWGGSGWLGGDAWTKDETGSLGSRLHFRLSNHKNRNNLLLCNLATRASIKKEMAEVGPKLIRAS